MGLQTEINMKVIVVVVYNIMGFGSGESLEPRLFENNYSSNNNMYYFAPIMRLWVLLLFSFVQVYWSKWAYMELILGKKLVLFLYQIFTKACIIFVYEYNYLLVGVVSCLNFGWRKCHVVWLFQRISVPLLYRNVDVVRRLSGSMF